VVFDRRSDILLNEVGGDRDRAAEPAPTDVIT
jgi:hypothetical protein